MEKDRVRSAITLPEELKAIIAHIATQMIPLSVDIENWEYKQAYYKGTGNYEMQSEWKPINPGEKWGGKEITAFFRTMFTIPQEFEGKPVFFRFFFGGEGMLRVNGEPFSGIDLWHPEVFWKEEAMGGETLQLEVEAYVHNQPFDSYRNDIRKFHKFSSAKCFVIDRELEKVYWDARAILEAATAKSIDPEVQDWLLARLKGTLAAVDLYHKDRFRDSIIECGVLIQEKIYRDKRYRHTGKLALISQSHLDLVYLWPYKEYLRKTGRTAANQLRMMAEFPDFKFSQSQPKMYDDLQKTFPSLWNRVKEKIDFGQWEIVGAMYVEPDCNIPSGEALVRQIIIGKRYYREKFGTDTDICWLPDVFGIQASLPQILKKAGVRYLSTIKLAIWNDTNIFPHTTFNWEGIDGSRVLVHFPPTHFVTPIDPGNMTINWKDNFQKKEAGISMYQFGWADGGGGPNREMWQLARRYKDCPGVPRSKISTIRDFFQRLDENSHRYPVWADELYLETHRGSYTTQAKIKAGNRKSELTLRDTEILSTFAEDIKSLKKITLLWKRVLVTQFHDTLAGSHIRETAESTEREYEEILGECARLKEQLLSKIAAKVDISLLELNNKTEITPLMVFNTLPWERGVTQVIKLPQGYSAHLVLKDEEGNVCPLQCVGIRDMAAVSIPAIPAMGYKIFYFSEAKKVENPLMANNLTISNSFFEIEFNESGDICRITDKKAKRQVLPQGALANTFHIYEDRPGRYSAWDIVKSYREREFFLEPADSVKIVERGPVRAVVEVKRKVLQSQLTQRIILWKDSPRIDFKTEIDWREDSKLLKVAFPVEVFSRNATYDIPFGAIERPTHATTSWDEAKFEVCGHKWADLSEGNYGVSLLTDSKYGYEVFGNTMRLTLLRAPTFPDPKADRGFHTFTYSLFPHVGNWREGGTVKEAFALNVPALIHVADIHGGDYKSSYAFLNLDTGSFVVETIKRNEEGVILLRGYESEQKRGEASIKFNFNIDSVYACNLLEEVEKKLTVTNNSFVFSYRPYEIRSFLIKLR